MEEHTHVPQSEAIEPQENAPAEPAEIAALGLAQLEAIAGNTPFLSDTQHTELFQQIAPNEDSLRRQKALRTVTQSYLGFSIRPGTVTAT